MNNPTKPDAATTHPTFPPTYAAAFLSTSMSLFLLSLHSPYFPTYLFPPTNKPTQLLSYLAFLPTNVSTTYQPANNFSSYPPVTYLTTYEFLLPTYFLQQTFHTNNTSLLLYCQVKFHESQQMLGSGVVIITLVCLVCCTWFLCIWSNELRKKYHVD